MLYDLHKQGHIVVAVVTIGKAIRNAHQADVEAIITRQVGRVRTKDTSVIIVGIDESDEEACMGGKICSELHERIDMSGFRKWQEESMGAGRGGGIHDREVDNTGRRVYSSR